MNDQPEIDKKVLVEYAQLKIQEKLVADRIKEMQPDIKEAMRANDIDKVDTFLGSFTLGTYSRWQYSDKMLEAVGDMQAKEKANGTAKQITSVTLTFRQAKEVSKK